MSLLSLCDHARAGLPDGQGIKLIMSGRTLTDDSKALVGTSLVMSLPTLVRLRIP